MADYMTVLFSTYLTLADLRLAKSLLLAIEHDAEPGEIAELAIEMAGVVRKIAEFQAK